MKVGQTRAWTAYLNRIVVNERLVPGLVRNRPMPASCLSFSVIVSTHGLKAGGFVLPHSQVGGTQVRIETSMCKLPKAN